MAGFSNIKIFNLVKWVTERAFLVFLFLVFISLILGVIIFYNYGILAWQTDLEPEAVSVQLKEDLYQEVSKEWIYRKETLETIGSNDYRDPFWIDIDQEVILR